MSVLVFFVAASALLMTPFLAREQFEWPKSLLLLATGYAAAFLAAPPLDALTLAACAWPLVCAVSASRSIQPACGFIGVHESFDGVGHQVAYVALFLAARSLEPDALRLPLLVAVPVVCLYALAQVAGRDPLPWGRVARAHHYLRPWATLGHPNHLGAWLSMAAPFVLAGSEPWRWPLVGLMAGVVALTISRAAWAAFVAGVGTFAALSGAGPEAAWALGAMAVVVAVTYAALPTFRLAIGWRLRGLLAAHREERSAIYRVAWRLFRKRPWLGVGPECFAQEVSREQRPNELPFRQLFMRAHSEPLHLLATTGVAGAVVCAAFLALLGRAAWAHPDPAPIAALVAFGVAVLPGFHVVPTMGLAALCAGMLAS